MAKGKKLKHAKIFNSINETKNSVTEIRGLHNLNNTCYLNSILQCLVNTPLLAWNLHDRFKEDYRGTLRRCLDDGSLTSISIDLSEIHENIFTPNFITLCSELDVKSPLPHSPSRLVKDFTTRNDKFSLGAQHDAFDAFLNICDFMRREERTKWCLGILQKKNISLDDIKHKKCPTELVAEFKQWGESVYNHSVIDQYFGLITVNAISCETCHSSRLNFGRDLSISLSFVSGADERTSNGSPALDTEPFKGKSKKVNRKMEKKKRREEKRLARRLKQESRDPGCQTDQEQSDKDNLEERKEFMTSNKNEQNLKKESSSSDESCSEHREIQEPDQNDNAHELDSNDIQELNRDVANINLSCEESSNNTDADIEDNICQGNESDAHMSDSLFASISKQILSDGDLEKLKRLPDFEYFTESEVSCILAKTPMTDQLILKYKAEIDSYPSKNNIYKSLEKFIDEEKLRGSNSPNCPSCSKTLNSQVRRDSIRRELIIQPPTVLTFHLKRFEIADRKLRKIQEHFAFPFNLDLTPFCSKLSEIDNIPVTYYLYGVVVHEGRLNDGHYYSYVWKNIVNTQDFRDHTKRILDRRRLPWPMAKEYLVNLARRLDNDAKIDAINKDKKTTTPFLDPSSTVWYCCNDSHVRVTDWNEVRKASAYLLFYIKMP